MAVKRIIPCLDIRNGRVVKGTNFENLRDIDDPIELAHYFSNNGADEIVLLDISATLENKKIFASLIKEVAKEINIPLTVGGGVKSVEDGYVLLNSGADRISINTAALILPNLINELVNKFGSQCIVAAIDAYYNENSWNVFSHSGKVNENINVFTWIDEVIDRGAGEILLTSINFDGTKRGFDIKLYSHLKAKLPIPLIASGGAGSKEDFYDVFTKTDVQAALAAGSFHQKELNLFELKNYLLSKDIDLRI
jgi:cyclase